MQRKGILKLNGANCASCAYTIEHAGRKIKGIKDIHVDGGASRVYIDYDGDAEVLDKVAKIVDTIGYEAKVIETDAEA